MTKIKLEVIKPWIQDKLTEILKMDDDVVVNFVYNQLEVKVKIYEISSENFFFIFLFSAPGSKKDADQSNWVSTKQECHGIHGRTLGTTYISTRQSDWHT